MSNESENIETPKVSVGQALAEIEGIRGEISAMGANDTEFASLDILKRKLEDREITSEQAIEQARVVRDSKQSYH